ncbi:MAG: hypothetical protein H7X89_11070 [Rhizobiales bacterium]|nr:hypothetical protein [Hyphomicrobiales bacterium]
MPIRIDPARFTGKTFTRQLTWAVSINDYRVMIDGLTAGRIMAKTLATQEVVWFWTMSSPYFPALGRNDGEEETLAKAQEAFSARFWKWHQAAITRRGVYCDWYGDD